MKPLGLQTGLGLAASAAAAALAASEQIFKNFKKFPKFGPVSQAGHRGKGKVNHKEKSRFLGESKTPFGDFLGYSLN